MQAFLAALLTLATAHAGNVIFIHPDGAGVASWQAARFFLVGPDGDLNWDRLPYVAVYRGHNADNLTSTSNGGATIHAYGVKAPRAGFGSDGQSAAPLVSAGGEKMSLMQEALKKGIRCGLVNSGSIIEPGSAAFVASVKQRKDFEEIARQVIQSGVDVILSGGEEWLLPEGTKGRHTASGKRTDKMNLIEWAKENGYTVVYDNAELAAVPPTTRRLLGVFAAANTFNDMETQALDAAGLPTYQEGAPTFGEMVSKALELLGNDHFFLVAEEEGTDNFGNYNNARGVLDALRRADAGFGAALDFLKKNPDTLIVTAADSEAGSMDVIGISSSPAELAMLAQGRDVNGAPYDTYEPGKPIMSAPDKDGNRHPFVISWGSKNDVSGGIVTRAAGKGAEGLGGTCDNTRIYSLMRDVLFEKPRGR
ncbi:MAG: alkaline phosphatase [Terrimicrobiaceae bacterium]